MHMQPTSALILWPGTPSVSTPPSPDKRLKTSSATNSCPQARPAVIAVQFLIASPASMLATTCAAAMQPLVSRWRLYKAIAEQLAAQRDAPCTLHLRALQIVTKASAFRDAPPTRKPSMSSSRPISAQLPSFTDPP